MVPDRMERHFRFNYPRKLLVVDEIWRKTLNKDRIKTQSYRIHVLAERCKGCEFCIEFCPKQVLHESAEFNQKGYHPAYADINNDCSNCGLCELICPEFAIWVAPYKEEGGL